MTISSATLSAESDLTIDGQLTWDDPSTLGGGGTIDAYGGIVIGVNGPVGSAQVTLDGNTLNNHGTATWESGSVFFANGAVLNNPVGATFQDLGQGKYFGSSDGNGDFAPAPSVFNNAGAYVKTGTGRGAVQTTFNNSGTVTVQAGELDVAGASPTFTVTGTFTAAAGTTMGLGYQDLAASAKVSGDVVYVSGDVACPFSASATFASNASFTNPTTSVGNLTVDGAVDFSPTSGSQTLTTGSCAIDPNAALTGSDDFRIDGQLTWDDPSTLGGGGTIDAYGGIVIGVNGPVGSAQVTLDGNTLNNHGTATWESGSVFFANGAVFNNPVGATFQDLGQGKYFGSSDGNGDFAPAPSVFNNAGAYVKTGTGRGAVQTTFNNSGTVAVQAGELDLSGPTANAGDVQISGGSALSLNEYTQTAGATNLSGGTLSGEVITLSGGALTGFGTINASVANGGEVVPGGMGGAGNLTVNGNYTQTAAGALDIDLAGTTAGSQYSRLAVSGIPSLGGAINVALIDGFEPVLHDAFEVLTFASSSGNFGIYNGLVLGSGLILDPALGPGNLTLTVQPAVTTTTLAAAPSPSVSGETVTFTAIVTASLPPTTINPVPTGTVTFYDNGTPIGTGTVNVVSGQDQAALATSTLSTTSHSITAAYSSGDANFIPSPISAAVTQVVNKANTTTTVAPSPNPSVYGQAVTLIATVNVVSPGSTALAYPTGTVTFYANGTSIGTEALSVVSGQEQAAFTASVLCTGSDSITAAYTSGDGNFSASTASTAVTQVVNNDSTTTNASASPAYANVGQLVTFTATISANAPGSGTPTGAVNFFDTTTNTDLTPGGVSLLNGTATFVTTSLQAGIQTITATYSGDSNFLTSSASTGTITIGQSIIVLDPTAGGALRSPEMPASSSPAVFSSIPAVRVPYPSTATPRSRRQSLTSTAASRRAAMPASVRRRPPARLCSPTRSPLSPSPAPPA